MRSGSSVYKRNKAGRRSNHSGSINMLIAVTFIFIAIILLLFASTSQASETKDVSVVYESIQVHYGDTLTSIAAEHNDISISSNSDYILEVKRLNNILDNKITAGEYLVIPVYEE